MKKNTIFFFSLLIVSSCTQYGIQDTYPSNNIPNAEEYPPNAQPGKCYAKMLNPIKHELGEVLFYEYTGDPSTEDVDYQTKAVVTKPSRTKWVKKKADVNCISPNPDDCLVWCLVEEKEETKEIWILKDTLQTKNFKPHYGINTSPKQEEEWREVVCKEDITPELVEQLQKSLQETRYYSGPIDSIYSIRVRAALREYQMENDLPIGGLDFETLDALGVEFED